MNVNDEEFLWEQKYRPTKVSECILPQDVKNTFQGFVDQGQIRNMLLTGGPGMGKTTVALAMCSEIGADVLFINASRENGIDVLRTKVLQFCSTVSLDGNLKVVILDEADRLSPQAMDALKENMESASKNTRFILTSNHKNKIIEPIQSRCSTIDFKIAAAEKPKLAGMLMKRVKAILDNEGISEYDEKAIAELIMRYFPDNRKVLNELQRYSASGAIDVGILSGFSDESFSSLVKMLKEKKFTEVRRWVSMNSDVDIITIHREIYDKAINFLEPPSIPELVLIIAEYQYKSAFVVDQEINTVAFFVEMMSRCRFK